MSSPKRNVVARLGTRHTVQKEGKRSNNTVLDVRGNVTVAVLAIDVTKQMNRPRVARSKACYFISLLLVLLLGDFAICAADSTRQCAVPVGTKSFVFSSEGHTLRGFIEATAGGRNQPAILILHGSGSTDLMPMIVRTVGTIERNEKLSGLPDLPPSCGTRRATGVVRDNTHTEPQSWLVPQKY